MTAGELIQERDRIKVELEESYTKMEEAKSRLVQAAFQKYRPESNLERFFAGCMNDEGEYTLLMALRVVAYRSQKGKAVFNLAWNTTIHDQDDPVGGGSNKHYTADSHSVIAAVSPNYNHKLRLTTTNMSPIEQLAHEHQLAEERAFHLSRLENMFGVGAEEENYILQEWRKATKMHDEVSLKLRDIERTLCVYIKRLTKPDLSADTLFKIDGRLFMIAREFNIHVIKEIGEELRVVQVE